MAIVAGVNIPDNKRVEIALTSIYGIGPKQAKDVIDEVGILNNPRVKDLSESELNSIRNIIDKDRIIEGDLRREVNSNIRRLIDIGSFKGTRHRKNLPVRGQRTRTNARSKRGRSTPIAGRKTVSK
jgi:small subunit ribosomal protein S13|tara:strand:- start:2393 stop:2770 length:378 start_codon:yes stop_codon:yes gene_type:complete